VLQFRFRDGKFENSERGRVLSDQLASPIWRIAVAAAVFLICYLIVAYLILPATWARHEHEPGLDKKTMVTENSAHIPGDPINVAFIGNREDVVTAFHASAWYPADPITLRTSLEIVGSVVLRRPYHDAPVSSLFFDGRREDLAFEKPDGVSAAHRQHVRLWQVLPNGVEGRPVWLGSASFDRGVGLSHDTGQVTHHIAPDLDAQRDRLINDLNAAHMVQTIEQWPGIGPTLNGRNGEGDPYFTDGEIWAATLAVNGKPQAQSAQTVAPPLLIQAKNALWPQIVSALNGEQNALPSKH
jgi:hypothetical protein